MTDTTNVNTNFEFSKTVTGKWILAGEHAVLRGNKAIVFPLSSRGLTIKYHENSNGVTTKFSGHFGEDMHVLFWGVLERGLSIIQKAHAEITGDFLIQNDIPLGAGLGASAALSVAVAHWFEYKGWLPASEKFTFARELEDLFHMESSGLDIAVVLQEHPLIFQHNHEFQPLKTHWQPQWFLSYSDQIAITSNCVKRVKELCNSQPDHAERIDAAMQNSVELALTALQTNAETGLPLLAKAINEANICFSQWGLAGGKVEQHISQLLSAGALAAKPTGAGDGGYVLSLWDKNPPHLAFEMIRI